MEDNDVEKLERALEPLRALDVPEEITLRAKRHLAQLRQRIAENESATRFRASSLLPPAVWPRMRWAAYAAAAAFAAVFAASLFWNAGGEGVVFADVIRSLNEFRPHSYWCEVYRDGNRVSAARHLYLSPTQRREEHADGSVVVWDIASGMMLQLDARNNSAIRHSWTNGGRAGQWDLLQRLANVARSPEALGARRVDGRLAYGFHESGPFDEWTTWIDPDTKLPIEIEVVHSDGTRILSSEFEFDLLLDPADFAMTPPAGYALEEFEHRDEQQAATNAFRPYSFVQEVEENGQIIESLQILQGSPTQRRETRADGSVHIYDRAAGQTLILHPDSKVAELQTVAPGRNDVDQLKLIRDLQSGPVEELGSSDFNGRQTTGFRAYKTHNVFTVWLDKETGLPVSIEVVHPTAGNKVTLRDFDFDVAIDETQFSTNVPEGYTLN